MRPNSPWMLGFSVENNTQHRDTQMMALIRVTHAKLKGAYGSPRMLREIRARGFPASKERVERLMRENGIRARHKRRWRATTNSRHSLPIAPNRLERNFTPAAPNQVWTADMTYIWTDEGWLYLAIVLDLFNREVVGWSIRPRMTADIVTDTLAMAWFRRKPASGLIHHTDRGAQGGFNWSSQHPYRLRRCLWGALLCVPGPVPPGLGRPTGHSGLTPLPLEGEKQGEPHTAKGKTELDTEFRWHKICFLKCGFADGRFFYVFFFAPSRTATDSSGL